MCPSPGPGGFPGTQAMILNHQYRFIFIKTRKTAGTSIKIALSQHCGPRDIITPISAEDEAIRKQLGYRGPQNYLIRGWPYVRSLLRGEDAKKRRAFKNHSSALAARKGLPPDTWASHYKFCFERNPWDKVISAYWWRYPEGSRDGLAQFILEGEAASLSDFRNNSDEAGAIIVDHVARFENLTTELAAFAARVSLPAPLNLPRAKGSYRADRRHYREVLTPEERDRIAADFAREVATFKYEF